MVIETAFLEALQKAIAERGRGFQTMLAKSLNIKTPTFSNMVNGRRGIDEELRPKIAKLAGIDYEELLRREGVLPPTTKDSSTVASANFSPGPDIHPAQRVPIISYVQAGDWQEVYDPFPPGYAEEWIETAATSHPNSFALRVHGDSMEPEFREDDIITVDPGREATSGSFVIAKNGHEATFKQLVIDGSSVYLKPLNDRYPVRDMTGHPLRIVGVVVEKRKRY